MEYLTYCRNLINEWKTNYRINRTIKKINNNIDLRDVEITYKLLEYCIQNNEDIVSRIMSLQLEPKELIDAHLISLACLECNFDTILLFQKYFDSKSLLNICKNHKLTESQILYIIRDNHTLFKEEYYYLSVFATQSSYITILHFIHEKSILQFELLMRVAPNNMLRELLKLNTDQSIVDKIFYILCQRADESKIKILQERYSQRYTYVVNHKFHTIRKRRMLRKTTKRRRSYKDIEGFIHEYKSVKEISDCSICFSESNIITSCDHQFCKTCIDKWLENHSTCPYCRQKIEKTYCIKEV